MESFDDGRLVLFRFLHSRIVSLAFSTPSFHKN